MSIIDPIKLSFPIKLMSILDEGAHDDVLSWLPEGTGFLILDKKRFESEILPLYFKDAKYTSFTRRLKRWRFVIRPRGHKMASYFHPFFMRGRPEECQKMYPTPQTSYNIKRRAKIGVKRGDNIIDNSVIIGSGALHHGSTLIDSINHTGVTSPAQLGLFSPGAIIGDSAVLSPPTLSAFGSSSSHMFTNNQGNLDNLLSHLQNQHAYIHPTYNLPIANNGSLMMQLPALNIDRALYQQALSQAVTRHQAQLERDVVNLHMAYTRLQSRGGRVE